MLVEGLQLSGAWQRDWGEFVRAVAAMALAGADDRRITSVFCGHEVVWCGEVSDLDLDDEFTPGARLTMPEVDMSEFQERVAGTRHLFLPAGGRHSAVWQGVSVGRRISFRTRISTGNPIFAGVKWHRLPNAVSLGVGLDPPSAVLVEDG